MFNELHQRRARLVADRLDVHPALLPNRLSATSPRIAARDSAPTASPAATRSPEVHRARRSMKVTRSGRSSIRTVQRGHVPSMPAVQPESARNADRVSIPATYETYPRNSISPGFEPTPMLDSYPRAFQLSMFASGQVFIAGQTRTDGARRPQTTRLIPRTRCHGARVLGHEAPLVRRPQRHGSFTAVRTWPTSGFMATLYFCSAKTAKVPCGTTESLPSLVACLVRPAKRHRRKFRPLTDATAPTASMAAEPLLSRRVYSNAIVLPDGTILVVGGNRKNHGSSVQPTPVGDPEFRPELYDPTDDPALPGSTRYLAASNQVSSSTWPAPFTIGPTSSLPRLYHSMAMLLPDASVFVVGGRIWLNDPPGLPQIYPDSRLSGEIFYPPYLFEGNQFAARPTIDGMTLSNVSNQALSTSTLQTFPVDVTTIVGTVKKVTLARPAAVTHHIDSDQRYIELEFTGGTLPGQSQQITVTAPSEDIAPPGFYMLFVLEDRAGRLVPSIATFVQFL